jgi:hypothetical protein
MALMPAYLIACERAVASGKFEPQPVALAALAGFLASWIHPWQGATLAAITLACVLGQRRRGPIMALIVCGAVTALPLFGYLALAHFDPAWRHVQAAVARHGADLRYVAVAVAPLALLAAPGMRLRGAGFREHALLAWPAVSLGLVSVLPFSQHALAGMALPLGVLAGRCLEERIHRPLVRAGIVAVLIVPGALHFATWTHRFMQSTHQAFVLREDEVAALAFLESASPPGGVLASPYLGGLVPAWTGRATWVGNPFWTPSWDERSRQAIELTAGRMTGAEAQALVRASGARYVLAGCHDSADLGEVLGAAVTETRRFGCAAVHELRW